MPFENWNEDHQHSPAFTIIIIAIALIAICGTAVAVYKITSPSVQVLVSEPATIGLTVNATAATVGDKLLLTAQLSQPIPNVNVYFYEDGNQIAGFVPTDETGQAIKVVSTTAAGTKEYYADCIVP